jgi:hypothetical protein
MKKKICISAAAVLGCFAVLLLGLYGYSRTDHAKNLVVEKINAAIPGTLTAQSMDILTPGAFVHLQDIQFLDRNNNTCLALDSLVLDIRFSALFQKVLEIRNVHIDRPRVHMIADDAGRINILDALGITDDAAADAKTDDDRPGSGIPFNLKITKAQITDGSLVFSDPDNTISVESINVAVSDADLARQSANLSAQISGVDISAAGNTIDIRSLALSGNIREKNRADFTIDLDSDLCVLKAEGSVDDIFQAPKMLFELDAAVHLAAVPRVSPGILDLGGTVDVTINGRGFVNNPVVQIQITGQDLRMDQTIQNSDLSLSAELDNQVFSIEKGQVNLLGMRIDLTGSTNLKSIFPEGFLHPAHDPDTLTYEITFNQQEGDLTNLHPWLPEFSGQFSSSGRVAGKGNTLDADLEILSQELHAVTRALGISPVKGGVAVLVHAAGPVTGLDITATVAGKNLEAAGIFLDTIDAEGNMTRSGQIEITRLLVQAPGMELTASGTADIFDAGFTPKNMIRTSVKTAGQMHPKKFLAHADLGIDLEYLDSKIAFDLDTRLDYTMGSTLDTAGIQTMTIPAQKIGAQIDLNEKNISVSIENMARVFAALDMAKGSYKADLDFSRSDFGPLLSAAGITGIHGSIDGYIRAAGRLPADLPPSFADQLDALQGSLTVDADVGGTVDTPVFNAVMDLSDLAWHLPSPKIAVSDLTGRIIVSPDHIRIQNLKTRLNDGRVSVNGEADFYRNILQSCQLALQVQDIDIPVASGSKTTEQVRIFHLESDLALALQPPGLNLQKSTGSHGLSIPVKQMSALIDLGKTRIELLAGDVINIRSGLDLKNSDYDLDLSFDNTLVAPFLLAAGFTGTAGTLTGHVTSRGNIAALVPADIRETAKQAEGTLSITAGMQGDMEKNPDQMDMALTLSGKGITLPVSSTPKKSETLLLEILESSLDIRLNYAKSAASAASAGTIPVKTIQALLDLNQSDDAGHKRLDLSATLDRTTDLAASFFPDTSVFDVDLTFTGTQLDRFLETAGIYGVTAMVSGHVLSRGRVNMVLPPQISEQLKPAEGSIRLDADIGGTFSRPELDARLFLTGLHYPVPEINLAVSNLTGSVHLSNDHVTIENLKADLGQGGMEISGDLALENFHPVSGQATLTAENIAISLEDTAEIVFNTDLTFSGTREKSALFGTVLLITGEYYKDFAFGLAQALESRKMTTTVKGTATEPGIPMIENTVLDIDVDYKDPFVLDNNLAFIMVEPDIKISGTIKHPVVTGRAQIVEGTVVYQKRQFEIQTGVIDFVDPFKTDPQITLHATTSIRKWTIHMDISGKTDNLRFRLYSNPAETHEDILSLLVLGKTTKELGQGGGSYTGFFTDKASEMVSQGVESSTPLDTFKLGYDDADEQGSNVSVTMGKQLSERLKVIYSMQIKEEGTVHTNAAEYKMLENVLLRAFNDSKGNSGMEVTLTLEFR